MALNSYLNFIITAYPENKKDDEQKKHNFTYKTKDNSLSIDFESESAQDITYTFTVENEKLLLVSTEKDKEITYELTKTNDG